MTDFAYQKSNSIFSVDSKSAAIELAIKDGKKVEIIYLKTNDVKTKKVVEPYEVGGLEVTLRLLRAGEQN